MKKIFFWYMTLSIIFPVVTWGQDNSGDYIKYLPRTVVTGDASALEDPSGDIERYRYNPIEDQWKWRANKAVIKYNSMENRWDHVYPGEVLRFNPAEEDWDYQLPDKGLRYHIIDEKWWYGYDPPRKGQKYPDRLSPTWFRGLN
jgi:hypothetical protein